jgi:hypothetical protein
MANYVMGLCSSPNINHPVEITDNPFCHYTYSNLTKVLSFWELENEEFLKFVKNYLPPEKTLSNGKPYRMLSHDLTKLLKPHSPCLPERGYVVESNSVAQNLSLSAGYYVSVLHINVSDGNYAPPLMMERLEVESDKNAEILRQIDFVMKHSNMPFKDMLTLFNGDTAYGKAVIIAPLYEYEELIGIFRMRSGIKVWSFFNGEQKKGGAPTIYGEKYYLRTETREPLGKNIELGIGSLSPNESDGYEMTMKNGREITVEINRWCNMLIRSKKEAKMKDKPMDIVQIMIRDKKTKKIIFNRPMFLAVIGRCKGDVTCREIQESYRQRFDVEGSYRFKNQNLLMNRLQSPEIKHQDKWLRIVMLSYWLLYVASKEITKIDFKLWQKYLPINKNNGETVIRQGVVTMSQTQKSIHRLFCTFEKKHFLPQKSKKGKGRAKGSKQETRKRHQIVKKTKKRKIVPT